MAEPGDNQAAAVLRDICCLLADYCSTHPQKESHKLAADYYFVSMLPIGEVCDRFNDQKKVNRVTLASKQNFIIVLVETKRVTLLSQSAAVRYNTATLVKQGT